MYICVFVGFTAHHLINVGKTFHKLFPKGLIFFSNDKAIFSTFYNGTQRHFSHFWVEHTEEIYSTAKFQILIKLYVH